MQENVAGWLQAGIIERSRSPYNLPIFCVPKKEGQGLRCVLDYRRLNSSSFLDRYALRTIDECLETVGRAGSKVYWALDCSSAFWQLELRPSDRPFTAFTIPGKGQYHWKTCPQGLMGAPSSFSRLMDVLLVDAENVLTYIDDVLVHSRSHEEHLKNLSAAIDKIGAANLRLNPKKCVFGSDSVEYLWHTLSGDGVRPGQDKAKAMQTAQTPRSVKELGSFCGLANYFRSYIVQFAIKAAPLFKLTRQDSEWRGPATRSFESISPAKKGDSKPASHGVSQRHPTIPPVCGCRPGRREQFGGAGSISDAISSRLTEETGGICIKEIGQARTELPGIPGGDAGGSFWDGTIPPLPHHREIRAVYRSSAFMQAIISPRQDIEQVATENDGASSGHQVYRREEQYRSRFSEQVPRDEHSRD
jgi:hypothetical protein